MCAVYAEKVMPTAEDSPVQTPSGWLRKFLKKRPIEASKIVGVCGSIAGNSASEFLYQRQTRSWYIRDGDRLLKFP